MPTRHLLDPRPVASSPEIGAAPRWGAFAGALLALAAVWLVVLPWLGRRPALARHIETQERLGIDPSAMFYTELEILPPIAHRIERLHDVYGADFRGR